MDELPDPELTEQTTVRGTAMQAKVIGLRDDHEAIDRDYFRKRSCEEKMAMIWPMFTEQWLAKGGDVKQLRLRRDIACLQRSKR